MAYKIKKPLIVRGLVQILSEKSNTIDDELDLIDSIRIANFE